MLHPYLCDSALGGAGTPSCLQFSPSLRCVWSCVAVAGSSLSDAGRCKLTPALTPTPSPSAPHATYRVITCVSTTRPLPRTRHNLVSGLQMSPSSAQLPTDFASFHTHPAPPGSHIGFICHLRFVTPSLSRPHLYLYALTSRRSQNN